MKLVKLLGNLDKMWKKLLLLSEFNTKMKIFKKITHKVDTTYKDNVLQYIYKAI